jgi:uncharacterized protein (DUF736 family)
MAVRLLRQAGHDALAEPPFAGGGDRDDPVRVLEVDVIRVHAALACPDVRVVIADPGLGATWGDATRDPARPFVVCAPPGPEPIVVEHARLQPNDADDREVVGGRRPGLDVEADGDRLDVLCEVSRGRDVGGRLVVRSQGLAAFVVAMASKFAWVLLMIVSLRVVGVSEQTLPNAIIFATVALVFVITVLPIAPGGAGVPELLYITFFTTYTGGADSSAITAGVMLFRGFQWLYPIPLSWILLSRSRRGKPLLPTKAEFQGQESTATVAAAT